MNIIRRIFDIIGRDYTDQEVESNLYPQWLRERVEGSQPIKLSKKDRKFIVTKAVKDTNE